MEQKNSRQIKFKRLQNQVKVAVLKSFSPDPIYGARPLKRAIQQEIENSLAQQVLSGQLLPGKVVTIDYVDGKVRFDELNLPGGTGCAFYQGYAG